MNSAPAAALEELRRTGKLPTPGGVALRLLELASREDVSAGELARVLQGDPSLAGRILRIANAAASGTRAVVSVADAVVRLGFRSVRQLAMGFSLIERCQNGGCAAFDYDRYWSRSLATAVAAARLGRDARTIPADECFTLGLLHEVGALALATALPNEYARVLEDPQASSDDRRCELEREALRISSRELTGLMMLDWRVPPPLVDAVVQRGRPGAGGNERTRRLADLLQLACLIGDCCVDAGAAGPVPAETLREGLAALGLERDSLETLLQDVLGEWRAWGEEFRVPTRPISVSDLLSMHAAGPVESAAAPPAAGPGADAPGAATPAAPMRVLVAEDVASQRLMLGRLLEAMGFEVETVADGLQALASHGTRRAEILVTDLMMPRLDGIGLCRAIRSDAGGAMTYVILLTGSGDHDKLVEAFEAGADDFVQKPVVRREFEARLRAARRVVALQQQLARDADRLREANARLEAMNRQLAAVALTDSLTGLPNRRHLLERLRQDWSQALRQGHDFCVVFVDIDHFKSVNDVRGHDAGDIVLERTARVLRRSVRGEDVVGRFGGEEFLIMCTGCDPQSAVRLAERIRESIAAEEFGMGGRPWHVTASFGIAGVRAAAGFDWSDVVRCADEALYRAKHLGRNRVILQPVVAMPEAERRQRAS
jgi:diguanylate cyclase (GGDEF)-like protein